MSGLMYVLPSALVASTVLIAIAPIGAPAGAAYVLQVMPYMVAHLFVARDRGFVPSPLLFAAGIVMDVASDGPLGFWPLIYLAGLLVGRQLPGQLTQSVLGRMSGVLLIVFVLAAAQVAVASIYQLKWVDWRGVLSGTLAAGLVTIVADLAWWLLRSGRSRRSGRDIVTERGGGTHV